MIFQNRREAGRELAKKLDDYVDQKDVIVLGLARGGLPVADEVAKALDAPLDVFLVQKLGMPGREELAMGAIASGGVRVLNQDVIARANISDEKIEQVAQEEKEELERREQAYRGDRERLDLEDKVVLLVDDGLATGASMRAAVDAVKTSRPKKVVVAVPTASAEACNDLEGRVDDAVCAQTPSPFFGVGAWYKQFSQVNDQEVRQILEDSRQS